MHSADHVISNLEQRLREHDHFKMYLRQLNHLFSFLNSVRLQGNFVHVFCIVKVCREFFLQLWQVKLIAFAWPLISLKNNCLLLEL